MDEPDIFDDDVADLLVHAAANDRRARAEAAHQDLSAILRHLPAGWSDGTLNQVHEQQKALLVDYFERMPGLAQRVTTFFERCLVHMRPEDWSEPIVLTNAATLFALLAHDYPLAFTEERDAVLDDLRRVVQAAVRALVVAVAPQVDALREAVRRIVGALDRMHLEQSRVFLIELPVGNSIPTKLLERALVQKGYRVTVLRIALARANDPRRGRKRVDLLTDIVKDSGITANDFVVYMDEWWTGTNFATICKFLERALRHVGAFLFPVALLTPSASDNPKKFAEYAAEHDERLRRVGEGGDLWRIRFPRLPGRLKRREPFFWSEHDRMAGYRKMQFWGSIFSSIDAVIENLRSDREALLEAKMLLLQSGAEEGERVPSVMVASDGEFVELFERGYEDYRACRDTIKNLEHSSHDGDVVDVAQALEEIVRAMLSFVHDRPAHVCVALATLHIRAHRLVDPQDRYLFREHAAVVTELDGDLGLLHSELMAALQM